MEPYDGDKVGLTQIAPVRALVIGNAHVMGEPDEPAPPKVGLAIAQPHTFETPAGQPNIIIQVVTPLAALVVRVLVVFLQTLLGLLTAGMTTTIIPATDFRDLVVKCASLSIAAAGICLLQNLITLFSKLEQRFPLLRA